MFFFRPSSESKGASAQSVLFQLMAIYLKAANHAALLLPERTKSLGQATIGRDIFEAAFKEQPDLLQGTV